MRRERSHAMSIDRREVKEGLKELLSHEATRKERAIIREALQLIRQMEGDLRRQGFTEYNDREDI